MRKEFAMGTQASAILIGALTLEQACGFALHCWPFPALPLALAAAAAEQLAQKQPGAGTAGSQTMQQGRPCRHH